MGSPYPVWKEHPCILHVTSLPMLSSCTPLGIRIGPRANMREKGMSSTEMAKTKRFRACDRQLLDETMSIYITRREPMRDSALVTRGRVWMMRISSAGFGLGGRPAMAV